MLSSISCPRSLCGWISLPSPLSSPLSLRQVHACVSEGGKVLIPVFALGRAQELCLLLDEYWSRVGLGHVPIFFSAGKPVQGAQWILCVCQKQ